jgi:hypothetical protein
MHQTTSPIAEVGSTANGLVKTLDLRGWAWTWNDQVIPMGGDPANFASDTQQASITCSIASCSNSSSVTLDYQGHVPNADPSNLGALLYGLQLEGHVVPVPAAVWLFGSDLIGLIGVARRK